MTSLSVHLQCMGKVKKIKKKSVKSGRHDFSLSSLMGKMKKKKLSVKSGRHEFSLSSLMGKVKKIKKKLSVKSGRHDISLSPLTMYGQSEENKIISKVRET